VPSSDDADTLVGKVIARNFRVEQLIGTGGMGRVYRARQISLDKPVVLKVLHPHFNNDTQLVQRFQREARAASRLNHPNSISIIDFGQAEDGTLFMAMELLHGRDLFTLLQSEFPLAYTRLGRIMVQVCSALAEAHAQNIIHRDLKPENIMVEDRRDQKDFVKVLDFGIAKIQDPSEEGSRALTQQGMVCGTPEYMSPEQARGENLDARSDIYAVGVLMFQLVTGDLPFKAETALGIVTKHITEAPPSPRAVRPEVGIPPGVEAIILRCMEKRAERRYQTAEELGAAWKHWLESEESGSRAAVPSAGRTGTLQTGASSAGPPTRAAAAVGSPSTEAALAASASPPRSSTAQVVSTSQNGQGRTLSVAGALDASDEEIAAIKPKRMGLFIGVTAAALVGAVVLAISGKSSSDQLAESEAASPPPPAESAAKVEPGHPAVPSQAPAAAPTRPDEPKTPGAHTAAQKSKVDQEPRSSPGEERAKGDRRPADRRSQDKRRARAGASADDPDNENAGRKEGINAKLAEAQTRQNGGDYSTAIALLLELRERAPNNASAAKMLGDSYYLRDHDSKEACQHWRDFVRLAPKGERVEGVKNRLKHCN
jgi:serine/threonine-protein kinase